jgi:hypothetical protein
MESGLYSASRSCSQRFERRWDGSCDGVIDFTVMISVSGSGTSVIASIPASAPVFKRDTVCVVSKQRCGPRLPFSVHTAMLSLLSIPPISLPHIHLTRRPLLRASSSRPSSDQYPSVHPAHSPTPIRRRTVSYPPAGTSTTQRRGRFRCVSESLSQSAFQKCEINIPKSQDQKTHNTVLQSPPAAGHTPRPRGTTSDPADARLGRRQHSPEVALGPRSIKW